MSNLCQTGWSALAPASLSEASRLMLTPPPRVTLADAAVIAARWFGIVGTPTPLSSERDSNTLIETQHEAMLLKIANSAETEAAIEAQTMVLAHIASRDPSLPVPQAKAMVGGGTMLRMTEGDRTLIVRMLSFLPGRRLSDVQRSAPQRRDLGRMLARLDRALRDFHHPGMERPLLWDITGADALDGLLPCIEDATGRRLVAGCLQHFRHEVKPSMQKLRMQLLHNDCNPHNLLVDPDDPDRICGIIDFGDMVRAPLVNELAVACAYDIPSHGHPLSHAGDLVASYHTVNPLRLEEVALLCDLVMVRQAIGVLITAWRARLHPENFDYILRNSAALWLGLERLSTVGRHDATSFLRACCSDLAA